MNIINYLDKCGVPKELHADALTSFTISENDYKTFVQKYKWLAPLVAIYLAARLPRMADCLPPKWGRYDNDISVNGDGWAVLRDGKWVRVVKDELPGETPISYSDPAYTGDAYYAKGFHPRSFLARYIWLGWRNRASKAALMAGADVSPERQSFVSRRKDKNGKLIEYVEVNRMGDDWQLYTVKRIGGFAIRRNIGYKINNVTNYGASKAAVTWIPFSILRWKYDNL